ncbi:hypothetical protein CAEBREN_00849 [Caenorhabditis brenneri]|uniref:Uncharacterized protein n=1 Tax=Caenorhabditis brenneri TaxID=135651 RepID=G0P517_CAEBE|nr:hypothetical protein CAEBREN_00849 [Caenorhabditis brenneri]
MTYFSTLYTPACTIFPVHRTLENKISINGIKRWKKDVWKLSVGAKSSMDAKTNGRLVEQLPCKRLLNPSKDQSSYQKTVNLGQFTIPL